VPYGKGILLACLKNVLMQKIHLKHWFTCSLRVFDVAPQKKLAS
jgi:hypothetical protein